MQMENNPYRSPNPAFRRKPPENSLQSFRLSRDFRYAPEYGPALWTAVKVQAACLVVAALILDRGEVFRTSVATIGAHWAVVAIILYCWPREASPVGLAFVRYGVAILIVITVVVLPLLQSILRLR